MAKLSFVLPKYDSAVARLIGQVKRGFDQFDPVLGGIQTVPTVHAGTIRQVSDPTIVETEMRKSSATIVLEFDWIRNTDVEKFTESILDFQQQLRSQQVKHLFEVVSMTSEAVGNVVSAKDKNLWDSYMEMIDKVEIHFNDDGGHDYKLYMHPNTVKKFQETPPTPEQLQRMEALMESKRQSFYARKRTRKLSR